MMRTGVSMVVLAVALMMSAAPARAEVLDAVYRGTMVCEKLPFPASLREAIDVTVEGGAARYSHVVRLHAPEQGVEQGTGTVSGQDIQLKGSWKGKSREYQASYSGTFVRRSAKLKGTQTWTEGGKTITRSCTGVIKRPFKVFLPRAKKPPNA